MSSRKRAHYADHEDEQFVKGTYAPLRTPKERVSAVAKAVQSCCLQERVIQDARTFAAVSTAGETVVCLNDAAQGSAVTGRVGDTSYMKHIQFKGLCSIDGTIAFDAYRFTLLMDRECFGNLCTYADVYHQSGAGTIVSSMFEYGTRTRFVPIVDKTIVLVNGDKDATTGSGCLKEFEIDVPLHFTTSYNGNAGTIADIVRNSLCLLQSSRFGSVSVEWSAQLIYRS